ncbi:MAG: hypothetical protein CMM07_02375 [Rhodopirellula sp.]|nr:hypothetical protein [Rhodopirellula sp.]
MRFFSNFSAVHLHDWFSSCVFYFSVVPNAEWRFVMQYRIIVPVLNQNFYFLAESKSGNIIRVVSYQSGKDKTPDLCTS